VAVLVVALIGGVAFVLLSAPPAAPTLDRVELTAAQTMDQGGQVTVTARAYDTAGVERTADVAFAWSRAPTSRAEVTSQADDSRADVRAIEAGVVNVTVTATLGSASRNDSAEITIEAVQFQVTASDTTPVESTPISLTVRAKRGVADATGYTGTVTFTSDDALATLPPNTAFVAGDSGVRTFSNVVLRTIGSVTITVRDTIATTITGSVTVDVEPAPGAPTARFDATRTLLRVDVNASASTDPENDIATYAWDFQNDGTFEATGASPTATHTYSAAGRYTIRLRVTDSLGNTGNATAVVTAAPSTLDYEYYDFFNVPYGEWWDMRTGTYGDLPINAECFSPESIADGLCGPTDPNVNDTSAFPYTNWYPLPGSFQPGNPNNNPMIYAPYRFRATGINVGGYNRSEPVFLPVLEYGQAPGSRLDFDLQLQYLTHSAALARRAAGCPAPNNINTRDGFEIQAWMNLTMDLQQSRRMFGVVAVDPTTATAWWATALNGVCIPETSFEISVEDWFFDLGNGKYDIYNSFEYFYSPFWTNISATVDLDGTTHVSIEHAAWGTEVLLARMFYWGNASYADNYLDSTKAEGWWGMELAWFEDLVMSGDMGAGGFNFTLDSAMQYHWQHTALPNQNGFDQVDDIPVWSWGPILTDYAEVGAPVGPFTELERYPDANYSYTHATPGGVPYGQDKPYDYVPISWDLDVGQTWRFEFPTSDIVFYDPNTTPIGADPVAGEYMELRAPLTYSSTNPASFGTWDAATNTWTVIGPDPTNGPAGSPGPDGVPGTADDDYALVSWGGITFAPGGSAGAPPASAPSTGSAGVEASWRVSRGPGQALDLAVVPIRVETDRHWAG
jgi:PKD repeat protein